MLVNKFRENVFLTMLDKSILWISCCKLTEMSQGIHDYAQMKRLENPNFNLKLLLVWQTGVFEGHTLLFKALAGENKICENCVKWSKQLLQIRKNCEEKLKNQSP